MQLAKIKILVGGAAFVVLFAAGVLMMRSVGDHPSPKEMRARADFRHISQVLGFYTINSRRPPTTEQGREALVRRPMREPLPDGWVQLMSSLPIGPWKKPYHYRELEREGDTFRWELRDQGPDGILWTDDDIHDEAGYTIQPQASALPE